MATTETANARRESSTTAIAQRDSLTAEEKRIRLFAESKTLPRLIGWQGFTFHVPDTWDVTGFSGDDNSGYLRIDDSAEQGLEIKWATEPKKAKEPDVTVRRESYFHLLRQTAKKKKVSLVTKEDDAPRGALRADRRAAGFGWTGDRRSVGVIWHCRTCRRTVIAQIIAPREGKTGLLGLADRIWQSFNCHDADPNWRIWSLYDLKTETPTDWKLTDQQLMNVYLRLTFAKGAGQISLEQWGLANIARKENFLDDWLYANSRREIGKARYTSEAIELGGRDLVELSGTMNLMTLLSQPMRDLSRLHIPAIHYTGCGWQSDQENKIYLVQGFTRKGDRDIVRQIAERTIRAMGNDK